MLIFKALNNDAVINQLFISRLYLRPLLGLFTFAILSNVVVILGAYLLQYAVFTSYLLSDNSKEWFNGYTFGFELSSEWFSKLLGLVLISKPNKSSNYEKVSQTH